MVISGSVIAASAVPLIARLAKKFGAKLLGKVLEGPVATQAAGVAVDAILARVPLPAGTEPQTTDDVIRHIEAAATDRGDTVREAVLDVEHENADAWALFWTRQVEETNSTMRAEAGSASVMQRTWRPFFGYVFAVVLGVLGFTCAGLLVAASVAGNLADILDSIIGLVVTLLITGAGVTGASSVGRSIEKFRGRA